MKFLLVLTCVVLCACANSRQAEADYYQSEMDYQTAGASVAYAEPYAESYDSVSAAATVSAPVTTNPYAMQAPAYETQGNFALKQKEDELFQKERFLLESQQELYEREKKLAEREAAFINRSKALDYKEQSINQGRYYAPISVPLPSYRAPVPVAPRPVTVQSTYVEETIKYNSASQPAVYDAVDVGYIIMQHPVQRDLVRCPVTDDVCLQSYERLGYVRSNNLSGYAAQEEVNVAPVKTQPSNTAGQWRENSSIPRW